MSALFRIVYAAHANGTHHKLALDGLNHMQRPDAEAWQRLFLKHVALYLEGSKAPDNSFKDFKNHVLHVGDDYWGGAPEKVEAWYGHTVAALKAEKWADAAYAAGVLSHYYTDPVHPFHTGQTEAENSMHRACEWSINRSYNDLRKLGEALHGGIGVVVPEGAHWQRQMTCNAAEYSHRYYEKLIAHYDLKRGVVRPEEGLDDIARKIVAELLMYAADGYGRILDRAIDDAAVAAPAVNLTLATFLATLKIPAKWIEKKLSNDADKKLVQAMYDELKATGKVEHTLPEDDRLIRDLHAREVLAPKLAARDATRAIRVPDGDPADLRRKASAADAAGNAISPAARASDPVLERAIAKFSNALTPGVTTPGPKNGAHLPPALPNASLKPAAVEHKPLALPPKGAFAKPDVEPAIARIEPAVAAPVRETVSQTLHHPMPAAEPTEAPVASAPVRLDDERAGRSNIPIIRRSYLSDTDDLEAAPSIGPKMAERFAELGIKTVADFLGHDPHDMAELLDDSRIDGETLTDWQDQAMLVIDIPGLRGTGAQLLAGAGYRTRDSIAEADPVDLSADVLKYAATSDGRRILRDGNPPDIEKIKEWVTAAQEALAA